MHSQSKKSNPNFISVLIWIVILTFYLTACEKKEVIPEPIETNTWEKLTDTAYLGGSSALTIRTIIKAAGYPQFSELIKHTIKVYKLSYKTIYEGDTIVASGIISFPTDTSVSRPVMLVGNGLIFNKDEAPSEFHLPNQYTGFEFIAGTGYVTLIPDMIGFGDSKKYLFPIHNYQYASKPSVDFYNAALEFIETKKIPVTQKLFLAGYSQGAYTALSVLKYIEESQHDIQVTATSIGAGGINLEYVLDYSVQHNRYSAPSHLALLVTSYNLIYGWKRKLNYFFQPKYASIIPDLLNGSYDRQTIDHYLPSAFDSLLNPVFYTQLKEKSDTTFLNAIRHNSIHQWAPQSPLKIFHSIGDERIPYTESETTASTMQSLGAQQVEFVLLDSASHFDGAFPFIEKTFQWFDELNN